MFLVDPLNPIRMVPVIEWDREMYPTVPFDKANLEESKRWYNTTVNENYTQKFINRDKPKNQIITDIEGVTVVLIKCETNQEFPITLVDTESLFTGLDATCYELTVDFSLVNRGNGNYFLKYNYVENEEEKEWCSEPIEVADEWPSTRCVEYTHSKNDWMVFQHVLNDPDPFVGLIRIESDINDFKPSSIDTIYADQNHNLTNVDGVAFRQFTFNSGPIPDWRADQMNRIMLCNQVKIDDQYYTKSEGAQWEATRIENSVFSEQKLVISESENRFQYQLDTSGITEEMMSIQKTIPLFNNTAGTVVINNKFKEYIRHESISVFNPTGATFAMTIEATSIDGINDMPLQTFNFTGELTRDFTWVWLFNSPKTYTITKSEGIPLDIIICYKKLNALPGEEGGGSVGSGRIRSGGFYHGTPEEFALDFDTDTGLGWPDGPYAGCAVCNGENNTPNLLGRMLIGADGITEINTNYPVNESGGEWAKQILLTDLPVLQHKIFAPHLAGSPPPLPDTFTQIDADGFASPDGKGLSSDDFYRINKAAGATTATLGNTNSIGGKNGDGTGGVGPTFSVKGKYYTIIFWKQIA